MRYDLEKPEHAYLLGFLLGDGHLYAGRGQKGRLSVELHIRDRDLLEDLVSLLPGSRLTTRTRRTNFSNGDYESCVLSCCRLETRSALREVGMIEGPKGETVAPPSAPFSARDFARGICDADGSLGLAGAGHPFLSLVTKSARLATWWCEQVVPHSGVRRTWRPNTRDGVANIMVAREAATALAAWLYAPGDLALERKSLAAAQMQGWQRPAEMRRSYTARRWTSAEDEIVLLWTGTQAGLAEELGRTVQSVNLRAWRLRAARPGDPNARS